MRNRIAKLNGAVQFEPVDTGADLKVELARGAIELAFGFDMPAGRRQFVHYLRQLARRQFELWFAMRVGRRRPAPAELLQAVGGETLQSEVTQQHPGRRRLQYPPARIVVRHDHVAIIETQFTAQFLAIAPTLLVRLDGEPRARRERDLLIAQLLRQIERRKLRPAQQLSEEFVTLLDGKGKRAVLPQQNYPVERA